MQGTEVKEGSRARKVGHRHRRERGRETGREGGVWETGRESISRAGAWLATADADDRPMNLWTEN